jgi:hypothetical protein
MIGARCVLVMVMVRDADEGRKKRIHKPHNGRCEALCSFPAISW